MFLDISAPELLVIAVVAVVAIGPKELPQVMRSLGRMVRRLQYVKFAMSRQFEDFMRENDLNEIRNLPKQVTDFDEAKADEEHVHADPVKPKDWHEQP